MKRKIKKVILICCTILISISGISLAKVRVQAVERYFKDIKIILDGNEILPKDSKGNIIEPFIIEGTTYLPVRAISESLGLDVKWDKENNIVFLNTTFNDDKYVEQDNDMSKENMINQFAKCNNISVKKLKHSETNIYYTSSTSMEIGETKQLKVYTYGNKTYTIDWTSSNNNVASIDENGIVTAKKAGKTKIYADISNGTTQSIELTVLDSLPTIKFFSGPQLFKRENLTNARICSCEIVQNGAEIYVEGISEILSKTNTFNVSARLYDSNGYYMAECKFNISNTGIKAGEKTKFSERLFYSYLNTPDLKRGETYYIIFE